MIPIGTITLLECVITARVIIARRATQDGFHLLSRHPDPDGVEGRFVKPDLLARKETDTGVEREPDGGEGQQPEGPAARAAHGKAPSHTIDRGYCTRVVTRLGGTPCGTPKGVRR